MKTSRALLGLVASLLLLIPGCKDPLDVAGGTSGAALYAFDSTTSTVLFWKDVSAVYDSASTMDPTLKISSNLFSKVSNLAWGGLCFDSQRGTLYLVSDTGTIVRVTNIRAQSGQVSSAEVASFALASSGRLTNGKFGQASLDAQTNTLYISESGDSSTQIWVVANASSQFQDATIALQALKLSGDSGGTGVAAASGAVYAFMADGNPVGAVDQTIGPRLRKGTAAAFDASAVILGSSTTLGIYGSLALDTANGYLFVARHNTDAKATSNPVLAFRTGQFGLTFNQAPASALGSASDQSDLRVLSHPGNRDWLVGLRGTGATGYGTILLWKSPLGGTAAKAVSAPSGAVLKGVAVDGNAS